VGRAAVITLAAFVTSVGAQQPAPPAATGVVSGAIVAADTGQPVRRAQVRLVLASPAQSKTVSSDGDGRFMFTGLRAGEYTLSATKAGYLDMVYGARVPGPGRAGMPIRLTAAASRVDGLDLRLTRGGSINGVITDEFGDPAMGTAVRVMRFVFSNGVRYATPSGQDITDDRGQYRVAGLMPGEYTVTAVPRDIVSQVAATQEMMRDRFAQVVAAAKAAGDDAPAGVRPDAAALLNEPIEMRGYVPIHYPGTPDAGTLGVVRVGLAEEVSGIDIRLQVVHTANVTGTVSWAEGAVPASARVQLLDPRMPMPTIGAWWTGLRPGGRFTFYGVAPGSYLVRLHTGVAGTDLFGEADVHVDPTRANDVTLTMQRGQTVSGTVALAGAPVAMSRVRVVLRPVSTPADPELAMERATPDAAGRFVLRGLAAVKYRFVVEGLPAGWTLGSARFGDRDAADYLLDIEPGRNYAGGVLTLTSRTSELTGSVTDAAGRPVVNTTVVVFPADRPLWVPQSRRIHTAALGADGRYAVRGLPAGDYRVALADPEPNQWFDVEFLSELLSVASPVTLADGDKRTLDLRLR
jgi:hypothetical protein